MAEEISYLKEAFKRQENVFALIGFGIAGIVFNAGFLFLGGMLEVVYLWRMSTNPRFQRVARAEKNREALGFDESKRSKAIASLPPVDKSRFTALELSCKKVYETWESFDDVTKSILQGGIDKLAYLLDTFLRTQMTLTNLTGYLQSSDKPDVDKQLKALQQEISGRSISEKLREAKNKTIEILKQRSMKLNKLQENIEIIKTQLTTLENAIKFIGDQSVSLSDPKQISSQIESVVSEAQDAENSIRDVESILEQEQDSDKKVSSAEQSAQKQGQS